MPTGRTLKFCLALSVLFHVAIAALSTLIPFTPRPAEDVMVVDLADLPRATDFLPPKPGIIAGARPAPRPKPAPAARKEKPPEPRAYEMKGPVPNLPVDPGLPPEKEFAAPREREEPRAQRPESAQAPTARAPEPGESGATKSLRDLTPTLGKMVFARTEAGAGRGQSTSRGTAAGTEAKARDRGPIAEERGGGAHLTPLNAPEIQYISYFAGIKRKIELVWQYPYDAQVAGIQGDLVVNFVIGPTGRLESVTLIDGSGHKVLDEEAMRAIRAAAPFDPIPSQYKVPNLQIRGHFVYEMHALKLR